MELKEKKLNSKLIYKGEIIDLYKDEVQCPNGNNTTREIIRHCKAVCILAKKDNKFILEQQYRYPYDDILYEFPAGKIDNNEDKETAAIRELEEETGYKANRLVYLGDYYPSCAYTDEVIHLFYADNLEKTQQHLDENEAINYSFYTLEQLETMVKNGQIKDGKSQSILYFYHLKKENI